MAKSIILLIHIIIFCCCCGDNQLENEMLTTPSVLRVDSQDDLDRYTTDLLNRTEIVDVIFNTYDNLDLSMFRNITKLNYLQVQTCQQINAFAHLVEVEMLGVQRLDEDCTSFSFEELNRVNNFCSISRNSYLESFAFPNLEIVNYLEISENESLTSINDLSALLEVDNLLISNNLHLQTIYGFQKCNSISQTSYYQIFFDESIVDYGNAFKELKHIANLNFTAHLGADLDWVSSIESAERLSFTGSIAPEQLCGLKPLLQSNDSVSVTLRSWLEPPFKLYANDEILDLCE